MNVKKKKKFELRYKYNYLYIDEIRGRTICYNLRARKKNTFFHVCFVPN